MNGNSRILPECVHEKNYQVLYDFIPPLVANSARFHNNYERFSAQRNRRRTRRIVKNHFMK